MRGGRVLRLRHRLSRRGCLGCGPRLLGGGPRFSGPARFSGVGRLRICRRLLDRGLLGPQPTDFAASEVPLDPRCGTRLLRGVCPGALRPRRLRRVWSMTALVLRRLGLLVEQRGPGLRRLWVSSTWISSIWVSRGAGAQPTDCGFAFALGRSGALSGFANLSSATPRTHLGWLFIAHAFPRWGIDGSSDQGPGPPQT